MAEVTNLQHYFAIFNLITNPYNCRASFCGGSAVKNLPAKQETWVRSLGQEDALEKEMATNSSILAWKI